MVAIPKLIGLFSTNPVELVFAEKTSIRRILGKRRVGKFVRVEDDMPDAEAGGELLRRCQAPRAARSRTMPLGQWRARPKPCAQS